MRVAKPRVDRDVRLRVNQLAESHEFIHAHIVGLHGVPRVIKHGRTLVDVADRDVSVPVRNEIAPRQSPHARMELAQQGDGIGTKPLYVVGRHQ